MSITDERAHETATPDTDAQASAEPARTIDLTGSSQREAGKAPGARPLFTITEAAAACGVSRKTITRKLADLAEFGAAKDDDGVWHIPVEALLAMGLHPGRSLVAPGATERPRTQPKEERSDRVASPAHPGADLITVPRDRWDDLRIRLARAEAQAAERELALADARLALRALTAGPAPELGAAGGVAPRAAGASPDPEPIALGSAPTAEQARPEQPATPDPIPDSAPDPVLAARTLAAQTGRHVPATGVAPKRRWWQSKQV